MCSASVVASVAVPEAVQIENELWKTKDRRIRYYLRCYYYITEINIDSSPVA